MAVIDKVINGLKHCTTSLGCFECPYSELDERSIECQLELDRDALKLLKEQQRSWKPDNAKGNYICGRCGNPLHTAIIDPMIQYCDHCGHKVDWTRGE